MKEKEKGKVKHNNKDILKTKETQKKEIEKTRDRDRSALRKKETEKMGDDEKNKEIDKKRDFKEKII